MCTQVALATYQISTKEQMTTKQVGYSTHVDEIMCIPGPTQLNLNVSQDPLFEILMCPLLLLMRTEYMDMLNLEPWKHGCVL